MTKITRFECTFTLPGGDCNAQGRMPISLMAQRIIEVATLHANHLGVGYDNLIARDEAWVLSRLSIEMIRYPKVNESYTLTTWVSSYNRRFSERDFLITDSKGNPIGHARTVWLVICVSTRQLGNLTFVSELAEVMTHQHAPIDQFPRMAPMPADARTSNYTFRYTDIDVNRHVNSVAYIKLLLDQFTLEHFDRYEPLRLDIAYMHEALYGETATVSVAQTDRNLSQLLIATADRQHVSARIAWREI